MRPPLIQQARQGNGTIADEYLRIHRQRQRERQTLEKIVNLVIDDAPELHAKAKSIGTAPGDERKLRGIPAIGRNVAGAIPGTSPHNIR